VHGRSAEGPARAQVKELQRRHPGVLLIIEARRRQLPARP